MTKVGKFPDVLNLKLYKKLKEYELCLFEVRYIDYEAGFWTIESRLTESRIIGLSNDHSVDKIRIYPLGLDKSFLEIKVIHSDFELIQIDL